jgi:hypothetical protein
LKHDEECSELLDERKQAKLQWLQNPRYKWRIWEYLKEKIYDLETNSKCKR